MILHTFHPVSLDNVERPEQIEMCIGSRRVVVETVNGMQYRVVRLISTDPDDYLQPQWQPGSMVNLSEGNQ